MKVLNFLFILINLFNYIDRGFISSLDTTFVEQYNISDTTSGFINSSFIIGYLLFSPVFSILVKKYNEILLIFIGLSIWSIFNIANTFFNNVYIFIILRSFIGIGEASYGTIVPPLIDNLSNEKSKSLILSIYFLAMPLGFALGFVISGFLQQYMDWHYLFLLEGCIVLFLSFFLLCFKKKIEEYRKPKIFEELDQPLTNVVEDYESLEKIKINEMSIGHKLCNVIMNKLFMVLLFGYAGYNFLIGSFSYWGPGYLIDNYNYTSSNASYVFGGITVGAGILGSASGGFLLDYLKNKYGNNDERRELKLGNYVILGNIILSYICCNIIFLINNIIVFFVFFFIAEFCLFALVGPINSMLLWSMEKSRYTDKLNSEIKVIGCALSICIIHLLGDVPSPILTGYIYDRTGSWNTSFLVITQFLLISIVSWIVTIFIK
jgi:MFS family permease